MGARGVMVASGGFLARTVPINRGFASHFGYLEAAEHYYHGLQVCRITLDGRDINLDAASISLLAIPHIKYTNWRRINFNSYVYVQEGCDIPEYANLPGAGARRRGRWGHSASPFSEPIIITIGILHRSETEGGRMTPPPSCRQAALGKEPRAAPRAVATARRRPA
jgi:hypothetical protein